MLTTGGWVLVFVGIALAGLVMVGCFAVWLWRRAVALLAEAGVLLDRADELAGLLEQIGAPPGTESFRGSPDAPSTSGARADAEPEEAGAELGSTSRQAT